MSVDVGHVHFPPVSLLAVLLLLALASGQLALHLSPQNDVPLGGQPVGDRWVIEGDEGVALRLAGDLFPQEDDFDDLAELLEVVEELSLSDVNAEASNEQSLVASFRHLLLNNPSRKISA